MEKECEFINLIFENLEEAKIRVSDIDCCYIEGIKTRIVKPLHSPDRSFYEKKICESFMLRLPMKAEWGQVKFHFEEERDGRSLFQRLRDFNDISAIEFLDKDENPLDCIGLPWEDGASGEDNKLQKIVKDDDEGIEIIISI